MIIPNDRLAPLLNEEKNYELILNKSRWSHFVFGSEVNPHGNVVSFTAPFAVGQAKLNNSIIIAAELPNVALYGGVCFQRLYTAQLGSLLSQELQKDCFVDEGCVFVERKQCSLSVVNWIKGSSLFHNIFSLCPESNESFFNLELTEEQIVKFQEKAIESFHYLARNVFLETQRDNI
jgi:hypothetical protein